MILGTWYKYKIYKHICWSTISTLHRQQHVQLLNNNNYDPNRYIDTIFFFAGFLVTVSWSNVEAEHELEYQALSGSQRGRAAAAFVLKMHMAVETSHSRPRRAHRLAHGDDDDYEDGQQHQDAADGDGDHHCRAVCGGLPTVEV